MHKRFQRAYTTIKENTFVSYAKIATVGGFCDIDLILVKATSPEDIPLRDRYVLQLLKIFSVSPPSYRTFATSFSRRFSNTKCWRVALKCLILLHRLLRALPYNSPFRTELLCTRSNGYLSLNPCAFRDTSSSNSPDYTHFISCYANLLNEALDCFTINAIDYEDPEETNEDEHNEHEEHETLIRTFPDKMKRVSEKLEILPQLQSLIDRVIECNPKGAAARAFLIHSALIYIIRDSFSCYNNFRCEIVAVLDHLIQLPYRSCMVAFGVYKKAAIQADYLSEFYDWCKSVGLCGNYEYPFVDRIPEIQIQALESFLDGMWQLTDQSSCSTGSPIASVVESSSSSMEDERPLIRFNNWVRFEEEKKEENALIIFETKDDDIVIINNNNNNNNNGNGNNVVSWEVLLEASVILAPLLVSDNYFYFRDEGLMSNDVNEESGNDLRIQVYNPYVINPFH